MKKNNIYIGTSGWSYNHWRGNFYDNNLPAKKWLNFYAKNFSSVEINNTFYRMPAPQTVKNWHDEVQLDFVFAVKASRYITHIKRLHDCAESLNLFFDSVKNLKIKLGPILFQLPPSFPKNLDRLDEFTRLLPKDHLHVFEFRHPSWFDESTYDLLKSRNVGLCITDLNGKLSPEVITSDFGYIRLHGPKKAYRGSYSQTELETWKNKIKKWSSKSSIYCFFDNDEKGYAVRDAAALKELLSL